jgi:hypothetical protein
MPVGWTNILLIAGIVSRKADITENKEFLEIFTRNGDSRYEFV